MVALHVFLLRRRLGAEAARKQDAQKLAQGIFDTMFLDMDENLREIGVGDLSVGKKVKQMAQAMYGRIAAYEDGLAGNEAQLAAAVRRNRSEEHTSELQSLKRTSYACFGYNKKNT